MSSLAEVFRNRESRVMKTVLTVDLTGSTTMKEQHPEAAWLTTYAWFYDVVLANVSAYNGLVVKFIGDGAMAVFSEDHAADAINCAIRIQENIADAIAERIVFCDCSIGIAYGDVTEFTVREGDREMDYVGTVVDKAFRLCSAASPRAIFIDTDTVGAAAMNRVQSRAGLATAPRRKVPEYLGEKESVPVKGFAQPVSYYEILWANTRYSVSAPFVSKLPSPVVSPISAQRPAALTPPSSHNWVRGIVKHLNGNYGFITANGEDFWFNSSRLFRRTEPVETNEAVWFIPADPVPNTKSRQATNIVALDSILDGTIEKVIPPPHNYGFVLCLNDQGESRQIFVFLEDSSKWAIGDSITFIVTENPKGIAGESPKLKAPRPAAA